MIRLANALGCCLLFASVALRAEPALWVDVARTIALSRTVRIPVATLSSQGSAGTGEDSAATLLVSPGAPDEPPEGPDAFDVLGDGRFLIADPLRRRIAVFDSQGKFSQALKIGFAADTVRVAPNGLVLVREASTEDVRVFDVEGHLRPTDRTALPYPAESLLLASNTGTVQRPPTGAFRGGPLEVKFERPGLRLLSLESLGTDRRGDTYVALESTAAGESSEGINLAKYVRRYDAAGKLVAEVANIPLDYYVAPVDELRVHKGIVYQLMPKQTEVRINVWDTN